ncbi:hypothetical protein C8R43DRAFT_957691 [Mycena crocata]|nr:hypothetical protein C8R43DRAFT_957691 [Mycena crocata]
MEGGGYGQVGQTVALFIFAAYALIACNYDAMTKYFNAVHDFKSEFDVVFAPRDGLQAKFTTKHRVFDMYNDLMDRVNGNILRTAEVLRQHWTFSIPNPFILDNEQHLDFHQHCRVLHEDIHQEFRKAMYSFFDGIGDWSGEGEQRPGDRDSSVAFFAGNGSTVIVTVASRGNQRQPDRLFPLFITYFGQSLGKTRTLLAEVSLPRATRLIVTVTRRQKRNATGRP